MGAGLTFGALSLALRPPPPAPPPALSGALIAHRAGLAHAPENSLEAIEHAAAAGADAIELDVRHDPVGTVVCAHDAAQAPGAPALSDALQLALSLDLLVELDLKGGPSGRALARDVVQIVEATSARDRIWISAFSPLTLWWVRHHDPQLPVGWPMAPAGSAVLDALLAWDGPALWVGASLLEPRADLATEARLRRWLERGWAVELWVLHDEAQIAALRQRGLAIVVDRIPGEESAAAGPGQVPATPQPTQRSTPTTPPARRPTHEQPPPLR